ncbi:MAG: OadG family protein [Bacteroidales bacterium]|nr:OadG family protein [Bacteroidales bacterium]MBN2755799.1 OadG family protein [Bacteroidales bacterium]
MNNYFLLDINAINSENIIIALVGYVIVFLALLLLYFVFYNIPKIINFQVRARLRKKGKTECADADDLNIPGTVNAAIAMAIHLYLNELHDEEETVMTIKKVSKTYSPWSSKIYGMQMPIR